MSLATVAVALIFFTHTSGSAIVPPRNERVVGGEPAEIAEAPWQVAMLLSYLGGYTQVCGGSVIAAGIVVTAADCTKGVNTDIKVRAGSSSPDIGGQAVDVARHYRHPNSSFTRDFDIALLFLVANLEFGREVAPIALPAQDELVADGSEAFVTGWGAIYENGTRPTSLYKLTAPVVNQTQCELIYTGLTPVTSRMICAGSFEEDGGLDTCHGDTGGPMVVGGRLHGISSWGLGCSYPEKPSVYTRVSRFVDWINENANK